MRALDIVEAVMREPVEGIGKPESLRLGRSVVPRLTQEHRIVYLGLGRPRRLPAGAVHY